MKLNKHIFCHAPKVTRPPLARRFYPNNVYRTKAGVLVVFLGVQDGDLGKKFGFFRELNNPKTFFGLKLSDILFTYAS